MTTNLEQAFPLNANWPAATVRAKLAKRMEGDFETNSMRYAADERYDVGWVDPRCVWLTPGL